MSTDFMPMVSVRFMVYNNEPYIREAVEGILKQKTNFKVEIVVGDDFSQDNTLNIIKEYGNTNNIYFNILKREVGDQYWKDRKKLGRLYNFKNIIENCSGKYIALLDGDDYWTDPLKLQKQVDFLEHNAEYSYCGHKSYVLKDKELKKLDVKVESFDFEELIFKNYLNTGSLVFRSKSIKKLPVFFENISAGDWALQLYAIQNSKAFVLDDYMSVYRVHDKSIWSSINHEEKCMRGVELQETFKEIYSDSKSKRLINKAIKARKIKFRIYKYTLYERIVKKIKRLLK